jgi:hypothetical protein
MADSTKALAEAIKAAVRSGDCEALRSVLEGVHSSRVIAAVRSWQS